MGGLPFRVTTALLALPGLALAVLGGINLEQRRVFQLPCDGVSWADSPRGVTAWVVARDGPSYMFSASPPSLSTRLLTRGNSTPWIGRFTGSTSSLSCCSPRSFFTSA